MPFVSVFRCWYAPGFCIICNYCVVTLISFFTFFYDCNRCNCIALKLFWKRSKKKKQSAHSKFECHHNWLIRWNDLQTDKIDYLRYKKCFYQMSTELPSDRCLWSWRNIYIDIISTVLMALKSPFSFFIRLILQHCGCQANFIWYFGLNETATFERDMWHKTAYGSI